MTSFPVSNLFSLFFSVQYNKHLFVHIGQTNYSYNDALLESVDIRQIYDKFPEKKGGLKELFGKGPQNSFFLIKFWVSESLQRMSICLAIHNMRGTIIPKRRHRNTQLVQEEHSIFFYLGLKINTYAVWCVTHAQPVPRFLH